MSVLFLGELLVLFNSDYWKKGILNSCNLIDWNLSMIDESNKSYVLGNILNCLRNLVEATLCFIYTQNNNNNVKYNKRYEIIEASINNIHNKAFNFLLEFHDYLQQSVSHYTVCGEHAERLMQKYIYYLFKIKDLLKNHFSINTLHNLNKYPFDLDRSSEVYYRDIYQLLPITSSSEKNGSNTYYVQKKKMVIIDGTLFFEYTLTDGIDNVNKFDRFIAYSKIDIYDNYAIRCTFEKRNLEIFGKKVLITFITDYWVAIRPCELNKLAKIFGLNQEHKRTDEYEKLMNFIKENHVSLVEIMEFSDNDYKDVINIISSKKKQTSYLIILLDTLRGFLLKEGTGVNVVKYLASIMINRVLKDQLFIDKNQNISNLHLKNGVLVFDRTPFSASLINHNPIYKILVDLFDNELLEDDIFARHIIQESNDSSSIYIEMKSDELEEIDHLIDKYNTRIPNFQSERLLKRIGKNIYVNGNESRTFELLDKLTKMTNKINFINYQSYISSKISEKQTNFDDDLKKISVMKMFSNSSLFCIYGAAGTGKSTLICIELSLLDGYAKLCLTNTHSALHNLTSKMGETDIYFDTIKSFIADKSVNNQFDVVVIDECSTVSTRDMFNLMKKLEAKVLILAGDIRQLPAIEFGNWFALLRKFIKKENFVDLSNNYRCLHTNSLNEIWEKVRKIDGDIQEKLNAYDISHVIDNTIFEKKGDDEITLALNYDGFYGINNLNRILQINNPNNEVIWKQHVFKVGDPIIFNDTDYFENFLFNNSKGLIKNIEIDGRNNIIFTIEVNVLLDPFYFYRNFEVLKNENGKSLIKLTVLNSKENDYDEDTNDLFKIPFEIAYAISIHKAQGLEYNHVKVIITKEVEEKISHNVFYTAITRAKQSLKVFWSVETENYVLQSFKAKNFNKDARILANKFKMDILND